MLKLSPLHFFLDRLNIKRYLGSKREHTMENKPMESKPAGEAIVNMDVETVLDLTDAIIYIKSARESGHLTLTLEDKTASEEATAELTDALSDMAKHLAGIIVDAVSKERTKLQTGAISQHDDLQVLLDDSVQVLGRDKFADALENPRNTIVIIPPEPIES